MREIKFRGKRISGHEMLLGDLNHINNKVYIFPRLPDTPLNSPDWFEVDPETVGQWTGLKDRNGKEIYEGDLIQNHKGEIGKIEFHDGGFVMVAKRKNGNIWHMPLDSGFLNNKNIIGNIYEHPELLNQ